MGKSGLKLLLIGTAIFAAVPLALAQSEPSEKAQPGELPYEVTETEIKLSDIVIDRKTREVRVGAAVCLETGILEYVVCSPNTFEHEAIFVTESNPELIHAALLLAGLKPSPQLRGMSEIWLEKAAKQEDSQVKIEVEWDQEGKKQRTKLSSLLKNREVIEGDQSGADQRKDVKDSWIFTGSFVQKTGQIKEGVYAAKLSGIIVGIWPDPSTVIQYGVESGNPYEGDHQGLEINGEKIPKLGTKVDLIFSRAVPLKKEAPDSKEGGDR